MSPRDELFTAVQHLELADQIKTIENYLREHGLDNESSTVLSMLMMSVLMDLDGGSYPADLVARARTITTQIRDFNEQRFRT